VGCCIYEVEADDPWFGSVPIGNAIQNTSLYILDEELQNVASGNSGELYIGGSGVARGYLNLPDLTEERFLPDPFSREPNATMYKTGDMVRCREPGVLEYLGRLDDQVKVRGYRIELGEIETNLAEHSAVYQSAAKLHVDDSGHARIVGYAALRKGHLVSRIELREFLRRKIPGYMLPASIVFVDNIPLTLNGKVDRRALPSPVRQLQKWGPIFPINETESFLLEAFREILEVDHITIDDSFLDFGGDSLQVIDLLLRIERNFNRQLSMAALFEAPTVSQLAKIVQNEKSTPSEVVSIQSAGCLSPYFCIGAGPLFRPLARHLGTKRPFLGITAPHPRETNPKETGTLEDIAAASLRSIRQHHPDGPYLLGGWSASGVLAYEIAQQLLANGHEVELLVLFDVRNPVFFQELGNRRERLQAHGQKIRFWAKELGELKLHQLSNYATEKVTELRRKIRQSNTSFLAEGGDIVQNAVALYRPQPYQGRVAFFSPRSRPTGRAWDFHRGWQELVRGTFETHEVPGDHRSMFLEPNVKSLAQKLSRILSLLGMIIPSAITNGACQSFLLVDFF
jgi:thioesterase domain-containing protein/acyl carrier protein